MRIMAEFFLLHALILLLNSDDYQDEHTALQRELHRLIKRENVLPSDLSVELFFSYNMHEDALRFLFYKKEYKDLLQLIRRQFERHRTDKKASSQWIQHYVEYCKRINSNHINALNGCL